MDNGVVELWELPEDKIYLILEDEIKEKLFNKAKSYAGNWNKLAEELKLHFNKYGKSKILESSRSKKISLRVLKKLINYLRKNGENIEYKTIEKSIIAVSSKRGSGKNKSNCLFNPNFPFDFRNQAGAIVISALLHDGGINSELHPHYSNLDIESRRKVFNAFRGVFGSFNFKRSYPESSQQIYFPKVMGYILVYGLGVKSGRKVTNDPGIPKFLFNLSDEIKSSFLRQAFDDEGHVHITSRNISLKLASYKNNEPPQLLKDLTILLNDLGVRVKGPNFREKYHDKLGINATKWSIEIYGQKYLEKFKETVNFDITYKKSRLNEIINTLKQPHFLLEEKNGILSESCKRIEENLGYITSADLAIALNRSQVLAKKEIRKLRESGILELLQTKNGNSAAKYKVVGPCTQAKKDF